MNKLLLILFLATATFGQSSTEAEVLKKIQQMLREEGKVTFSSLYNDGRFSTEQKGFLGRLYEIFFALPGYLKTEFEATGSIPKREMIAQGFGVSPQSVELLLTVMESDARVPPLYTRDATTREIDSLNLANIDAFLASKGTNVKMTQWEGQSLPSFSLETFDEKPFSSDALLGKNSLVYFWFTGCPPCVRIAPILAELEKEYRSKGVVFLGINADDVLEIGTANPARQKYVQNQGIEFLNVNLDAATRSQFGSINVYPTLFLVAPDGTVKHYLVNFQSREKLQQLIEGML